MDLSVLVMNDPVFSFVFVPNFLVIGFSPHFDGERFVFLDIESFLYRKEDWIPGCHAWRVSTRQDADFNAFVQLRGEVASKAMKNAIDLGSECQLFISAVVDLACWIRMQKLGKLLRFVDIVSAAHVVEPSK